MNSKKNCNKDFIKLIKDNLNTITGDDNYNKMRWAEYNNTLRLEIIKRKLKYDNIEFITITCKEIKTKIYFFAIDIYQKEIYDIIKTHIYDNSFNIINYKTKFLYNCFLIILHVIKSYINSRLFNNKKIKLFINREGEYYFPWSKKYGGYVKDNILLKNNIFNKKNNLFYNDTELLQILNKDLNLENDILLKNQLIQEYQLYNKDLDAEKVDLMIDSFKNISNTCIEHYNTTNYLGFKPIINNFGITRCNNCRKNILL